MIVEKGAPVFARRALSFTVVDRIDASDRRAASQWRGRIAGVMRLLLREHVERQEETP